MPKFGKRSLKHRATIHPKLQKIVDEAIKHRDFTILEGVRSLETQKEYVKRGVSKTLNSKHLPIKSGKYKGLSRAVDLAPYPIDWDDKERFIYFAGFIMGIAAKLNIRITWGGDWDGDGLTKDHKFFDSPHFQLDPSEV